MITKMMKKIVLISLMINSLFAIDVQYPEVEQTGKIDFKRLLHPQEGQLYRDTVKRPAGTGYTTPWIPNSAFSLYHRRGKRKEPLMTAPKWELDIAFIHDRQFWSNHTRDDIIESWYDIIKWYVDGYTETVNIMYLKQHYTDKEIDKMAERYDMILEGDMLVATEDELGTTQRWIYYAGETVKWLPSMVIQMIIVLLHIGACNFIFKGVDSEDI